MAVRFFLVFLILLFHSTISSAVYEDQVGLADWHQRYIGKTKHAVFHSHKTGRKRVFVSTEENVIASLDLRTGDIFWRHVLGENDPVNQVDIALGKYIITLSSEGSVLRAWNLPDGQLIWESVLQFSAPSSSLLHVPTKFGTERESLIFVFGGGWLHAVSSIDGVKVWKKELYRERLEIQQVFQQDDSETLYAVGFLDSLQFVAYHINTKNGEVLKESKKSLPSGFYGSMLLVSRDILVALDASRSIVVSIKFSSGSVSFHQTYISDIAPEFSGIAEIVPTKLAGLFALRTDAGTLLFRVNGIGNLVVENKFSHPTIFSDSLSITEEHQVFSVVQHSETKVHIAVKFINDLMSDVLEESIELDPQKGSVQKIFINNYVKTDRSNGFRVLLVMEDHSLLLVQQGKIVWSREDGLASVVDSTTLELPVEKIGVSVAKVEHSLFEWLKGHMLKLKGTLMLATSDDLAALQEMRLRSSEKTKMTRDHNGFRKLIIVLTKAGKVFALHTGDGRVVWSLLLPSLRTIGGWEHPSALKLSQWQVPHHHAMDENPSVLVLAKCEPDSGVFSIIDSYTGKLRSSQKLPHSIFQVIRLPLTDSTEQHLHLVIDSNFDAHLYPRTAESIDIFLSEISNIYWYSVDSIEGIMRGYSFNSKCKSDMEDRYCFNTKELWSIIFPAHSEKLAVIATRKMNEVVHTQAKVIADQDVMYKYISRSLLFVATVAPKAAGEIGSVTPEEAWLIAYLIDAVTGRILHRVIHQGAQGPVNAVVSENWVVYHYFNLRAHRYEMSVIEIYDQSRADNKDVLKLVLGNHNLTSPFSLYSRPEVMVKSQSYFFTHSVKVMAVTTTAKGITSKQLLIGTITDQVLALDKRYLDPRRTANPTPSEKEEGIIPLTDSLPIIPQSHVTHSLQVEGIRGIVTFPAKLESSTLVFAYGVDLFFSRITPSRSYDSLTEDFNFALLLITIVALLAAILVTWVLSEKRELRDKWR
ncbi:ER membrane protein complex subunit 1 [Phalaenopsis equestris]|uniref:ER membrane protein complex subunit 1 n=1 Tax=Phalaenopsis equestris TaxID=78828 RepID=UPI0009E3F9AA|nr:ER membrane protein complex subunit 1 [Phalaenopsis equestris]